MHALAAAQQAAVTASSSMCCSTSYTAASLLRHGLVPPSQRRCALSSSVSSYRENVLKSILSPSSLSVTSCKFVFMDKGLQIRRSHASVLKSGNTSTRNKLAKKEIFSIICLASRKDRREMAAGEKEFEPDLESLRTGFSKKFPGEDASAIERDWDELDKDDGVKVKSFKGGRNNYGRAVQNPTTSSNDDARDNYTNSNNNNYRSRNKADNLSSRLGGSRDERRNPQVQGIDRQRVGFRDSRNQRTGAGGVDGPWSESTRNKTSEGPNIGSRSGRKGREWSKDTPIFEDEGRKKKPVIEPVNFTSSLSSTPHVAILGGGMSGLVCALTLEKHGIHSTVFDTGKHGLGGRMATRYVDEHNGERLVFDHAAQFFTATDPRFQNLVDRWMSEGFVKSWNGNVGTLRAGGQYSELPLATRYIGTNGMRSLADAMLSQSGLIDVKRPCWISRMDAMNGRWTLTENRKFQGEFDVVVIAHNGKCANRLLSTAHVPLVTRQMKRLELSSIWALLAAFKEPLPLPGGKIIDGAFVDGVDSLSWMGNNSRKLVLPDENSPKCWTFLSTAAYGKRNKVPQESIPVVKGQKVKQDMLRGVEAALGLSEDSLPEPIYTRLQLWGAALPTNTPDVPCIFDAQGRVGICGDWLLGSSLESAALSGMALADHIAKYRNSGDEDGEDFNIGLQQSFSDVKGSDIGQFPGTEELPKQSQEVFAIA
ncbi:unnamed protein product [Calypogeia fissa]